MSSTKFKSPGRAGPSSAGGPHTSRVQRSNRAPATRPATEADPGNSPVSVTEALRAQRQRGFALLRFQPHIERGFQLDFFEQGLRFRRILLLLGIISVGCLAIIDHWLLNPPQPLASAALPVQLGVIMPALLLALVCAVSPRWQDFSEATLLLAMTAAALATQGLRLSSSGSGYEVPLEYTATIVVAVFFLGRVSWWRLLPVVVLITACMLLNEWWFVHPSIDGWYRAGLNVGLIVIAVGGGYAYEYVQREAWLNARLLEQLSNQDPLTGLLNRRAFAAATERGLRQASREGKSIGLALLDIDHFKAYNDHYGHLAGDDGLRRVADILLGLAQRPLDSCARYGGEEFVVAWFDGAPQTLQEMAESALARIRALGIEHRGKPATGVLTASMGLVTIAPTPAVTLEQLIEAADRTMYQAKQQGRDRLVVQHLRVENLGVALRTPTPATADESAPPAVTPAANDRV